MSRRKMAVMVHRQLIARVSVHKVGKHASGESGDTAEIVERAGGGFSVVLVDGQGSGRAAKALSLLLSARAVSLLKDGIRDQAAVHGVHDFLMAHRNGLVSATVDIVTLTPATRSIGLTRQSSVPMAVDSGGGFVGVDCTSGPIGHWTSQDPCCSEHEATGGFRLILTTDGIAGAGSLGGSTGFDVAAFANERLNDTLDADQLASSVLDEAIRRDCRRPRDDLTVVALTISLQSERSARRMMMLRVPL